MLKNILAVILMTWPALTYAQVNSSFTTGKESDNSSIAEIRKNNLYQLYSGNISPLINLINGREYFPYYSQANQKPILKWGEKYSSVAVINGIRYNDILLEYDTYMDEVVFLDGSRTFRGGPLRIAINKDNIDLFELITGLDTLKFKYLKNDSRFSLNSGFYEDAYNGNSRFIIKHSSHCSVINGINEYPYHTVNYADVGNGFMKFKSIRQLIRLMGNYSTEVRKYCRKQGVPVGSKDKKQIAAVLSHYDNIRSQAE